MTNEQIPHAPTYETLVLSEALERIMALTKRDKMQVDVDTYGWQPVAAKRIDAK